MQLKKKKGMDLYEEVINHKEWSCLTDHGSRGVSGRRQTGKRGEETMENPGEAGGNKGYQKQKDILVLFLLARSVKMHFNIIIVTARIR